MTCMEMKCDVKDMNLAEQGENNINWAIKDMPVLSKIRKRFEETVYVYECVKCIGFPISLHSMKVYLFIKNLYT